MEETAEASGHRYQKPEGANRGQEEVEENRQEEVGASGEVGKEQRP